MKFTYPAVGEGLTSHVNYVCTLETFENISHDPIVPVWNYIGPVRNLIYRKLGNFRV